MYQGPSIDMHARLYFLEPVIMPGRFPVGECIICAIVFLPSML